MKIYGLIGKPLSHSFSKKYFIEKFEKENISGCKYELFELEDISELNRLVKNTPRLSGLNVTIPYKESVIPYLYTLDPLAWKVGAVNVVRVEANGKLQGFNSDYHGFRQSLESWLSKEIKGVKALVLGSGGAAKAVKTALNDLGIPFLIISRSKSKKTLTYQELNENKHLISDHRLIINTTPLGMGQKISLKPEINYDLITEKHYLYDLVYNPGETAFMMTGKGKGAKTKNGLEMLKLQAEKSWEIWNSDQ